MNLENMTINERKEYGEKLEQMVQEINGYEGGFEHLEAYDMSMLDDLLCGMEPSDILMMSNKNFNIHDDYFRINELGHLESFNRFDYYQELLGESEEIEKEHQEYI